MSSVTEGSFVHKSHLAAHTKRLSKAALYIALIVASWFLLASILYIYLTMHALALNKASSSTGVYDNIDMSRLLSVQAEQDARIALAVTILVLVFTTVFKLVRTIQKRGRWYNYPITPLFRRSFVKLGRWVYLDKVVYLTSSDFPRPDSK